MAKDKVVLNNKSSLPVRRSPANNPPPKNSNMRLLERKPESETVVGSISKRLASAILGGNWNDGGR